MATAAVAVLALAPAGCAAGGQAATPASGTGTVHGTIVQVGGPAGAEPGHPAGTVTVTGAGRRLAEQRTAEGGEYRFTLSPGAYRLAVTGVDGGCQASAVTVTAGGDQAIDLTCQRK